VIRKYGTGPIEVAAIHGGPGACGSMAPVARELSKTFGAVEPIQSRYSISELIGELHEQLNEVTTKPVTLISRSWGAWLVVLYAARHPELVEKSILVGADPFDAKYVPKIMERRFDRLSDDDAALFRTLLRQLEVNNHPNANILLERLGELAEKADSYNPFTINDRTEDIGIDGAMHASIWPEADAMRRNGELKQVLRQLKCPLVIIHGEHDPHPVEGVTEPLTELGIVFETYILPRCGHSPFKEQEAARPFYEILADVIKREPAAFTTHHNAGT